MSKTQSEALFEKFLFDNSIAFEGIEPTSKIKTPDYVVIPNGIKVAIEVKELLRNDVDNAILDESRALGVAAGFSDPSDRIRSKINEAYKQIKARTSGTFPGVLVLVNFSASGIDSADIKNAMYGHEGIEISGGSDGTLRVEPRLLGGRRCSPTQNRSLSAVALLTSFGAGLILFHNIFSTCRLPLEAFRFGSCRQFSIDPTISGRLPEWFEV